MLGRRRARQHESSKQNLECTKPNFNLWPQLTRTQSQQWSRTHKPPLAGQLPHETVTTKNPRVHVSTLCILDDLCSVASLVRKPHPTSLTSCGTQSSYDGLRVERTRRTFWNRYFRIATALSRALEARSKARTTYVGTSIFRLRIKQPLRSITVSSHILN